MKKISKLITILLVASLLFCGCGADSAFLNSWIFNSNVKPDDELSKAIRKAIGNDLYYSGRMESDDYGMEYHYRIREEDFGKSDVETISRFMDTIDGFVDTIDGLLKDQQGKVTVLVYVDIPGAGELSFGLQNYSDASLETADYDGLYSLSIYDMREGVYDFPFLLDPATYTVIKGIKKLEIGEKMQQRAEEEGIDWYAYWPDLEEIIVSEY